MDTDVLIRNVNDDLFIGSSRVLLRDVISARRQGLTPEETRDNFPSLSLAQVHGALVYYLEHQDVLDAQFAAEDRILDELHSANRAANAAFFGAMRARLESARTRPNQTREAPGA